MDRESLVDVGVALVSRFGAKGLSLTSVARQAGVARATAYRMFGGRDALVDAIVNREITVLRDQLRSWDGEAKGAKEVIHGRVTHALAYIREHEALQYMLRNEPEEIVRAIVATGAPQERSLIPLLVERTLPDVPEGVAAELHPDPRRASEYMIRVVYTYMLVPDGELTDDEIADLVVRAIVR